jgi:hypothetical protein
MGVYPMLVDDNCWFLAADFDKGEWRRDVRAFAESCRRHGVPVAIERSRSGNSAHAWIFFAEALPAALARRLGAFLITETMECLPDIGFESYDRFFPNQDTMPSGGFGNLIALPLQGCARSAGNSVFVDESYSPYPDQWAFLSGVKPMARSEVDRSPDLFHGPRKVREKPALLLVWGNSGAAIAARKPHAIPGPAAADANLTSNCWKPR